LKRQARKADGKSPLLWTGILFALAANLLSVTVVNMLVEQWQPGRGLAILTITLAPLVAGVLTALYVRQRGGMHAFIGGMISVPILAFFIIPGLWQTALLCGAFCTLGGALTELVTRRRALS
jgi:hypothetical protein